MPENFLKRDLFQGQLSIEEGAGWLRPWRLPHDRRALFPSPADGLMTRAGNSSGVRLRFATASTGLTLRCLPLPEDAPAGGRDAYFFDATVDGELLASAPVRPGETEARFEGLPAGAKVVELWLPQEIPVSVSGLTCDDGTTCAPAPDERPRWITYGSSLTHCTRAHSPARTWPAIVARRRGLHLTSLGFGGQCHLDAMVGMLIADLPADYITLKLGINCIGGTLDARTFPAAVVALVQIIRAKHPGTPIGLISPIGFPPRETEPNVVGYTISDMRAAIADVHERLVGLGDENLHCFNGLDIFDLQLIARYAEDECHPDGDGIEVKADNFDRLVMEKLLV